MTVWHDQVVRVKDLIEQLQKVDPDLPVCIAGDDEGNNFRLLYGPEVICGGYYDERDEDFTDRDPDEESDTYDEAMSKDKWNAICIW